MTAPPESEFFPSVEFADPDGLIAVGGKLTTKWLIDAYQHGIFPWPVSDDILAWWTPDPRAIVELDQLHVSRRLARTISSGRYQVSCNRDFPAVIKGCATAQDRRFGTWLTTEMQEAYIRLNELGLAHSIEVWREGELAGGTYGIALGGMFAAESKFYLQRDASKVAIAHLVSHLRQRGFQLLDIQQLTSHMASMGATEITRDEFLRRLSTSMASDVTFGYVLEPYQAI